MAQPKSLCWQPGRHERAGMQAWIEPRYQLDHSDDEHTDVRVALGARLYYRDVSVVHPTCSSYFDAARAGSLRAAKVVERRKIAQCALRARQEHATFFPFVIETFGGFGDQARKFTNLLAIYARSGSDLWTPAEIRRGVQRGVHVSLSLSLSLFSSCCESEGACLPLSFALSSRDCFRTCPARLFLGLCFSADFGILPLFGLRRERERERLQ